MNLDCACISSDEHSPDRRRDMLAKAGRVKLFSDRGVPLRRLCLDAAVSERIAHARDTLDGGIQAYGNMGSHFGVGQLTGHAGDRSVTLAAVATRTATDVTTIVSGHHGRN